MNQEQLPRISVCTAAVTYYIMGGVDTDAFIYCNKLQ